MLSVENLENFNFEETKRNVAYYFRRLDKLEWELAKLNIQKGLTTKYNFTDEDKKQRYIPMGKDIFGILPKELKAEELKKYILSYFWAMESLSDFEQEYIKQRFRKHKYNDEIVEILGFYSIDSREFKRLKKSAIYKFADLLNLLVEKNIEGA